MRTSSLTMRLLLQLAALLFVLLLSTKFSPIPVTAATQIATNNSIPDPTGYKHLATIPTVGAPTGIYTGEFSSSDQANVIVEPSTLPKRPFIGTELYYLNNQDRLERKWLEDLDLDFLRVEVTPDQVGMGLPADGYPFTDFTNWTASDFESGQRGWHFNSPDAAITNILNNISQVAEFPVMMMNHRGGESYMGNPPNSDQYTEYFLATVYYYNVIRGMNIKYWEVLNEPDWGWHKTACSPDCYAAIFQKVVERIKSQPDARVSSIRLGGPVLGSGDPIDGDWPDGYPNRNSDGGRDWRGYIPALLTHGLRDQHYDLGFLSWHDYGDSWGLPKNMYNLDQNYVVINRVEAFYHQLDDYAKAAGERPPLAVTELNFDAGTSKDQGLFRYKDFYADLWHTSTLNDYLSTGKVTLISHFFWRGTDDFPKGLIFKGNDSGGGLVRNPSWFAYKEYIDHTQDRILASYNGRINRWADAVATTDETGKMIYLIAVNKNNRPSPTDFSFPIPESLAGQVAISKEMMQKDGNGTYGGWFRKPVIDQVYEYQPITFEPGKQIHYTEIIPPLTIVYYTVVRTGS